MNSFCTKPWVGLLALLLAGCGGESPVWRLSLEPLPVPAAGESLAPRLAADPDGGAVLSWLERVDGETWALRYARLGPEGWTAPEEIARGDDWFINWADTPAVQPLAGGGLVAHWLRKSGPAPYAYDVIMKHRPATDADWSAAFSPHHDRTHTEHGFVSLLPAADGGFGVLWLDGRRTPEGGGMTLRHADFDALGEQQGSVELDGLTCDCCPTDAARGAGGWIAVYRDRSAEEIRDIRLTRQTTAGWSEPVRVHADGWRIAGCPVNGPAVAAAGERVAVAWFTAAGGRPRVWLAQSADGGRSFGAPVRIDAGAPLGRVDLVMHPRHGLLAGWLERTGEGNARFLLRAVAADGTASQALTVTALPARRASGFPHLLATGEGLIAAWTVVAGDTRRVASARLLLER